MQLRDVASPAFSLTKQRLSSLHGKARTTTQFLLHSEASQQSFIMTAGNFVTAGIMGVAMIVVSRFMGPTQFGVFSVSMSLMFILNKAVDAGLDQLIPRFIGSWQGDKQKQKQFLGHVLWWKILLSVALCGFGLLAWPWLAVWLNYPYPRMIIYSVLGGVLFGLYNYVYMVFSARHRFFLVSVMSVCQAILKAIGFSVVIMWWQANADLIAISYYVAPFLAALAFLLLFSRQLWAPPALAEPAVAKQINRFWGHAALGVVMMTLIANADILLVQKYLDSFATGIYSGATKVASFVGMVTASIGGVLNSRVARYKDKKTLLLFLRKASLLFFVAAFGFVMFVPLAKYFILYTIGEEYLGGEGVLILLVLNAFLSMVILPLTAVFYSVDEPSYFSINGVIQVVCIFGVSLLFLPQFGILAAAWSRLLASLLSMIYTVFYLRKALTKLE